MSHKDILSQETLELLGLTQKDLDVYKALLRLGSAPLRRVAEEANLNRGTAYDALKHLVAAGLASHVDAKTHRYFTAEDPHKLRGLATRREVAMREAALDLDGMIPGLAALRGESGHRPAVRYYEGDAGVRDILADVLEVTERAESRTYRVYSTAAIRGAKDAAWPSFSRERIRRGVRVRAIAIGKGGSLAGLDERRWLSQGESAPTYIAVYPGKTAYISMDANRRLFGVIIEDAAIAATQEMIFDALWKSIA
jgi:sugar-specific transcriptional regulator TrmB